MALVDRYRSIRPSHRWITDWDGGVHVCPEEKNPYEEESQRDASIFDSFWTVSVIFVPP